MRISNKQLLARYNKFDKWLSTRTHRERICLLLIGCITIFLIWYLLFEKPVLLQRGVVSQQIDAQKKQLAIFQREIEHVTREGGQALQRQKLSAEQLKNHPLPVIEYATTRDSDQIIKQILLPQKMINFISLKTQAAPVKAPTDKSPLVNKSSLEITFNSNYFATMSYLAQLEKLPWCMSWDSLDYKVSNYPAATVVINLHIVNN